MWFSTKVKGFLVDKNDHAWLLARVSSMQAPLIVEELKEIPLQDTAALQTALTQIQKGKPQGNYLSASCSVYPAKRVLRRASLELKRLKEPNYLNEVCAQQLRIEPDKLTLAVLNANDGTEFDLAKGTNKEVLIGGLPSEDIVTLQDALLETGIYPVNLELGSLSAIGAALDYLKFMKNETPTLLLELGNEMTHSFILGPGGVEATRSIAFGIDSMVPIVHRKLSLKDEDSARKLFLSNTFDFTSMGPELVQRLVRELQSSIGFFEVQTGQSIGQLFCLGLPPKLGWLENSVAASLGINLIKVDLVPWLQARGITFSEHAVTSPVDLRWFGLLSLLIRNQPLADNAIAAEKKV